MGSNLSESAASGGLQAMLARLRAMVDAPADVAAASEEPAPASEEPPATEALTVLEAEEAPVPESPTDKDEEEYGTLHEVALEEQAEPAVEAIPEETPAGLPPCPICHSPRVAGLTYCDNCGLVFPADTAAAPAAAEAPAGVRLMERYELGQLVGRRGDISRYRGFDHGAGASRPVPVVLVRSPKPADPVPAATVENLPDDADEEILPSFDLGSLPSIGLFDQPAEAVSAAVAWPSLDWERALLERAGCPVLPQVVGQFTADGFDYLVEEVPTGQSLWDAWDDPEATAEQRFGWLRQIAEGLRQLHDAGAILEGLRPDIVVITSSSQAMLTDLSDLLPLPLPAGAEVRGTLYTAPELMVAPDKADARADLYSFGAMLYALHVGRELTETAFDRPGVPKPFIPFFPDVHPLIGRLMSKTFWHDVNVRFPTDEASREDPTGFAELIRTLDVCRRTLDHVRLEVAAWTTTGMIRTGNEDAFALMHTIESRQDDLSEYALVLLADGMGGYEAGEVAAGIAIQAMRRSLLGHWLFAALAGDAPPGRDEFRLETCQEALVAALKEANRQVYEAARSGQGRRGMGCTSEAVYVDGRHVVVGHVGDSRTYHLRQGKLVQMTRDQTLIARLLELGQLTPEEAEAHPRRSELQQAIGGRTDVDPEVYHARLRPGDWVLVCSDGLSNHVKPAELQEMLQSEATSAEMAARRLVNFANLRGATDNATVVVIRAT